MLLVLVVLSLGSGEAEAQDKELEHLSTNRDSLYRVELFAEAGPMTSIFLHKRVLPENVSSVTGGYNMLARIKWHPDHLLSVGFLTGFQHLVSDKFTIWDSRGGTPVNAALTCVPLMVDVSLNKWGFELGAATGFWIFTTWLTDGQQAIARRWELATFYHGAYFAPIGAGFSLGGELLIGFSNYRAVLTVAPEIILKYELYSY
jgi:hypothetical protein